jgi:hypothetical protein
MQTLSTFKKKAYKISEYALINVNSIFVLNQHFCNLPATFVTIKSMSYLSWGQYKIFGYK